MGWGSVKEPLSSALWMRRVSSVRPLRALQAGSAPGLFRTSASARKRPQRDIAFPTDPPQGRKPWSRASQKRKRQSRERAHR